MKSQHETIPAEARDAVGERRHDLALETKDEHGRHGLLADRVKRLEGKLSALQIGLEERRTTGEKFDATHVLGQINEIARALEKFTEAKQQSDEHLKLLETRAASLVAGFDHEHPERQ